MPQSHLPTDDVSLKVAGVEIFDSDLAALPSSAQQQVLAAADAFPEDAPEAVLPTTASSNWRRVKRLARDLRLGSRVADPRDRAAVRSFLHGKATQTMGKLVQQTRADRPEGDLQSAADAVGRLARTRVQVPKLPPSMLDDPAASARRTRRAGRGKKRQTCLAGLGSDWQVRLLRAADPRDRAWIAVLAVTGVRPGALSAEGVRARTEGDAVHLWVPGSKNSIGCRHVTILNTAPVSDALFRWVRACGGEVVIASPAGEDALTYDQMAARHAAAARRAFGRAVPLTAHRQQLHADAKAAGWSTVEIAAMTDKTSTRSVTVYATAQQGRGGAVEPIQAVTTDWAIRPAVAPAHAGGNREALTPSSSERAPDAPAPTQMGPG